MEKDNKEIKKDNPMFQYKMGIDLFVHKQEYEEGMQWLKKSADQGYLLAMDALGMIFYKKGEFEKAFQFWSQAVEHGLPEAKNNLGWLYYSGEGVKQDLEKAYTLHAEAALSNCLNDNIIIETVN